MKQEGRSARYVKKVRVPVRLSQPNGDPRNGSLELVQGETRPETIFELLNSARSVIPFILDEGDTVLLLTRANIDWVAIGSGITPDLVFPPGPMATHEQRVELRFLDESRVEGMIEWRAGDEAARLSDFLGEGHSFIGVRARFGVLIVNKQRVREVRVLESTPRPLG